MFRRIAIVAFHNYREAVRARVLYGLAALALGTALYAIAVGAFALEAAPRVVSDLGASSISLYAILVSIVLTGTSLYRELEQKTVFPILARPIGRGEYLVGKYFGTVLTLFVFIGFDAAAVLLIVATMGGRSPAATVPVGLVAPVLLGLLAWKRPNLATLVPAPLALVLVGVAAYLAKGSPDELRVVAGTAALSLLEVGIVAAVATLFASFSSPYLSTVFTLAVFIVGRSADALTRLPVKQFGQGIHDVGVVLSKIVPNLHVYTPPRPLLTGESATESLWTHLGQAGVQTVAWAVLLLAVSTAIFRRRDFL